MKKKRTISFAAVSSIGVKEYVFTVQEYLDAGYVVLSTGKTSGSERSRTVWWATLEKK